MSAKVLSIALAVAIIALPVPASQLIAGTFSKPAQGLTVGRGDPRLATLLADPFLNDQLSFTAPQSFLQLNPRQS